VSHVTAEVQQTALGSHCADQALEKQRLAPDTPHAWAAFADLAARHGWRSPACAAFIATLAKRARG
jgi:hypothetical protein